MKLKQWIVFIFLFFISHLCYSAQLAQPVLIAPINGVKNISPVAQNFSWKPVTGATSYRIVVVELGHFKDFVDEGDVSYCSNTETCFTEKVTTTKYSGFKLKSGLLYQWFLRAGSATIQNSTWASSEFVTAPITLTFEGSSLQGSPGTLYVLPDTPINISVKAVGDVNSIDIDWFGDGKKVEGKLTSSGTVVTFTNPGIPFTKGGRVINWSATAYAKDTKVKSNMLQGSFYVLEKAGDCFVYVRDVTVPDGSTFLPGTAFDKTWAIRNCGTTTWNNYKFAYAGWNKNLGTVSSVAIPNGVAPASVINVTVPMKAPTVQGRYKSYWKAKNASNQFFDRFVFADIYSYKPNPKAYSQHNCKCTYKTGNPIDTATGAQNYTLPLLSVSGLRSIDFVAHYHSLVLSSSPMGFGWGHNYETNLTQYKDGNVRITWRSNREDFYDVQGDGSYKPRTDEIVYDKLVKNANGTFILTRKDKNTYFFSASGLLRKEINPQGQELRYEYNDIDLITKVTEPVSGVYLQFNYDSIYRLTSVSDPINRKVEFSYNDDGYLIAYKNAAGQQTSYTLNTSGQVVSAVNPEGIKLFENTFDSEGRITYQKRTRDIPGDLFGIDYSGDTGGSTYSIIAKDHYGKAKKITYQDGFIINEMVDELGNKTQIQYDDKNNPVKITDAKTRITTQTFDSRGNLTSRTDAAGTIKIAYDSADNPITVTDARGKTTRFTYNNHHQKLTQTDAENKTSRFTYNSIGKIETFTSPEGRVTQYSYQNGRVSSITDAEGYTVSFTYDTAGRVNSFTNGDGFTTMLELDNLDRIVKATDALGHFTSYRYDSRGQLLETIDPNGNSTSFEYDGNKNLIKTINALGYVTQYEYDANDRLFKIIDPRTNATTLSYDAKGRVVKVTDAYGNSVTTEYDETDQVKKRIDPLAQETLYAYDQVDNLVKVTNALNKSTQFGYDQNSNVTAVTDALKRTTAYRYDAVNRLIESTDALTHKSGQKFDGDGNVTTLTDPNQNNTGFTYDRRGLLTDEVNAVGNKKHYAYNGRRLLSQRVNGRNQAQNISYDNAGRVTQTVDAVGTTTYGYDNAGNVLTVKDKNGTITRTYDKLNRVTSYTNTAGETIRYGYDRNNNNTVLVYPDGRKVWYGYDKLNRMVQVTDWANRKTFYVYDANGRLTKTTRPNGSVEIRSYNKLNQLTLLRDVSKGKLVYQVSYSYDDVGNITEERVIPDKMVKVPVSDSLAYNTANQITRFAGKSFDFDGDGNMIKAPFKGAPYTLQYNARNQLVFVTSGYKTAYRYDAEGYRTHQIINNSTIRYTVNPEAGLSQILVQTRGPNKTYYVYGLGLIGEETHKTYLSYHFDYRGSTVARTNIVGAEVDRYSYNPFGGYSRFTNSRNSGTPFAYNGRDGVMTDMDGLYYMRARYYSPELQRFVSQDALLGSIARDQSLNRYAFTEGNPVRFIDPTGHYIDTLWDIGNVVKDVIKGVKNVVEMTYEGVRYGYAKATNNTNLEYKSSQGFKQDSKELGSAVVDTAGDVFAMCIPGLPAGFTKLDDVAEVVTKMDPKTIRFTQDSISSTFKNGGTVENLSKGLKNGTINANEVPAIKIFEKDGLIFSLDNRRLKAFQDANIPINTILAKPEELIKEAYKFTTKNNGASIVIRK